MGEIVTHQRPEPRALICHRYAERTGSQRRGKAAIHHLAKAHLPLHTRDLYRVERAEEHRQRVNAQRHYKRRALIVAGDKRRCEVQQHYHHRREPQRYYKHRRVIPLLDLLALHERRVQPAVNDRQREIGKYQQQRKLPEHLRCKQTSLDYAYHEPYALDRKALYEFVYK